MVITRSPAFSRTTNILSENPNLDDVNCSSVDYERLACRFDVLPKILPSYPQIHCNQSSYPETPKTGQAT
ncbi:hypothetical protein Hdeb2414_s1129g00984421 [Helianthus debilis subsp. tardiflorus]